MYLMKMRTGLPSADVGNKFKITRTTVDRLINKVRKSMSEDFAYNYVNYIRDRDELIQLNTGMGRGLFCGDNPNRVVIICDGTYIYIHKSRNYEFQKRTYSDQKKRNFVKIMMCVTCDGEIIYALGPYPATQNDASILKSIFEETDAFDGLHRGDILMLDRGFRDCVGFLQERGIEVKMPALVQKSKSKSQLSTKDANKSRLVTAIRFVVEARNGNLKTIFKIFEKAWSTPALKHLLEDVEICAAIINCYFSKIESNKGSENEIIMRMLAKVDKANDLARIVGMQAFQNIMKHAEPFDDINLLPSLTESDLILISFGKYQIKQAESYCQEHLKAHEGRFELFSLPENEMRTFFHGYFIDNQRPILLYSCFKSRFNSAKKHRTYVLIDSNGESHSAVLQYCCSCYSDLRTVGCCSHIMSIIWYSLHAKDKNHMPTPAAFLNDFFN